jgi:hypothetical protein
MLPIRLPGTGTEIAYRLLSDASSGIANSTSLAGCSSCQRRAGSGNPCLVRLPESAVAYTRASVMHFSDDGLLKRTDFDLVCGETLPLAAYSSAHQSFSGLTVPTLHRAVRRNAAGCASRKMSLLDIEIFDAAFD